MNYHNRSRRRYAIYQKESSPITLGVKVGKTGNSPSLALVIDIAHRFTIRAISEQSKYFEINTSTDKANRTVDIQRIDPTCVIAAKTANGQSANRMVVAGVGFTH
jgi:hypothetical protein